LPHGRILSGLWFFTFFAKTQVAAKLPALDKNNPVSGLSITPTGIFANNFAVNYKGADKGFRPQKTQFLQNQDFWLY